MSKMFKSFTIKGKEAKNRIVYPPMVIFDKDVKDGMISDGVKDYYKAVAKAGCAIMVVEATAVADNGLLHQTVLGIWDDRFIEGLSALPVIAHENGAIALIQLVHGGGKAAETTNIVAPSNHRFESRFGENDARALTSDEIESMKASFVAAGVRAKKAGFDGIELHSCHGYLLNQFLSNETNKRDDIYGKEKSKIVVDIIKEMRKQVGEDFIISIRMPGNDPNLTTCIAYAKQFEAAGVDLFHISAGILPDAPNDLAYEENPNYNWIVATGIEIKKHVSKPVIVVNGIRTPEQANHILDQTDVDFVAIARGYVCDLNWTEKAKSNESVIKCISCKKCLRFTGIYNCVL